MFALNMSKLSVCNWTVIFINSECATRLYKQSLAFVVAMMISYCARTEELHGQVTMFTSVVWWIMYTIISHNVSIISHALVVGVWAIMSCPVLHFLS